MARMKSIHAAATSLMICLSSLLAGGCGHPSERVSQEPPPRPATQESDLPPTEFLEADLVVTLGGDHKPYCYGVDELLSWLESQAVTDQQWTRLSDRVWRLDGFAFQHKEHTVWIFEQSTDGVELVGYKDSDIAERTHQDIMKIYYPYVRHMHGSTVRNRNSKCTDPYD
jgi:hypothetical protein